MLIPIFLIYIILTWWWDCTKLILTKVIKLLLVFRAILTRMEPTRHFYMIYTSVKIRDYADINCHKFDSLTVPIF